MKKLLAIVALVAFLGGMSAPVIANDNVVIEILADKDPKKAEKKSGDCSATEKKASDCSKSKKASDCSATASKKASSCGG